LVDVIEVVNFREIKRIRGRISQPAGWITLYLMEDGRNLATSVEASDPGLYFVDCDDLPVHDMHDRSGEEVARLSACTTVNVEEFWSEPIDGRIRARIEQPCGWIDMHMADFSTRFMKKATNVWICQRSAGKPFPVRTVPSRDPSKACDKRINPGEMFQVSEEKEEDDTIFLKLHDGRGWVFDYKPDSKRHSTQATVKCPKGHPLKDIGVRNSGWACDARCEPGGCKSGITDFHQTDGMARYNCEICDYDLCVPCWSSKCREFTVHYKVDRQALMKKCIEHFDAEKPDAKAVFYV
jgi:hypothetical protein